MDTKIVKAIQDGNALEAHTLIEEALVEKTGAILEEKKKQTVAKTYSGKKLAGKDEKSILKSSLRKAFKEKMGKLNSVKKNGKK